MSKAMEDSIKPAGLDDLQILLIKSYIDQYDAGTLPFIELRTKILDILGVKYE